MDPVTDKWNIDSVSDGSCKEYASPECDGRAWRGIGTPWAGGRNSLVGIVEGTGGGEDSICQLLSFYEVQALSCRR